MNVLVVAAHPDDEVLGCGGVIARLASEGHDVTIAIFGEGVTSRYADRTHANPQDLTNLRTTAHAVATLLGARELVTLGLPDNRFDTVPLLSIVKDVERLIAEYRPSTIFTHSGGDLNVDHVVLHRAVLTATRPMAGGPVRELHTFQVASSTEWAFGQFAPTFRPSLFVDVERFLERKLEAMALYESEARVFPHPRSPEALRAAAQHAGVAVGMRAAEAFETIRQLR